ncbi:MAG: peptidoglycan DD-metalloendopeptidase family protein [Desulfobacterales bacterium]
MSPFSQTISKSIIIAGALWLILGASTRSLGIEPRAVGIITAATLHMRSEPVAGAPVLHILRKGTRVKILGHENGWYRILGKDTIGYIRARERYVVVISEEKTEEDPAPSSSPDSTVTQFREEAKDINRKIETSRAHLESVTRREAQIINGLDKLDLSLNRTRNQVRSLNAERKRLSGKIRTSEDAVKTLSEKIALTEEYASKRLVALYKLSSVGKTQIITATESIYDILFRQRALARILVKDEETLNDLWQNETRLQKHMERQSAQIGKKHSVEQELKDQERGLSRERKKRARLLATIRTEKTLEKAAIDALSRAATTLDEKIKSLNRIQVGVSDTEPMGNRGGKLFSLSKGLLNMPVNGKIINEFGSYKNMEFNIRNFRNGIDILADQGEPIRSVHPGKVLYAKWFKGYGNMIIIDHGENYYTIYAHIEELFKSPNETVEEDEVIATVGDTGSRVGAKLYFELRHHGKPLDPLPWIKKG